jgi:hypothetical protein
MLIFFRSSHALAANVSRLSEAAKIGAEFFLRPKTKLGKKLFHFTEDQPFWLAAVSGWLIILI